jgi:hypothetical protein
MQHVKSIWAAIAVASSLFAISAPAHAQVRTWVSATGDDMNPCSRTAPCKTFAGAIGKTATNGIINCIDNAGYGSVTITRSMTIDCHETLGSILVGDTAGIVINIPMGDPKDTARTVRLRNIDIAGSGATGAGVSILSAAAVIMEDMSITQVVKQGISDVRTESNTMLVVKNSIIANNVGAVGVQAAAAPTNTVILDNVHSDKNAYGIAVAKGNSVVANRSVLFGNTTAGAQVDANGQLTVDNSVVSYNAAGIAGSGSTTLANTDISYNATALGMATTSYGNNRIFGNFSAGTPPTPAGVASPAVGQQ